MKPRPVTGEARFAEDIRTAFAGEPEIDRELICTALHRVALVLERGADSQGNEPTAERWRALAARFRTYRAALQR